MAPARAQFAAHGWLVNHTGLPHPGQRRPGGSSEHRYSVAHNVALLDFCGIVELFGESWCMLRYQLSAKIPAECNPESSEAMDAQPLAEITHGIPNEYDVKWLPASVQKSIDMLTDVDAQSAYTVAVVRFLRNALRLARRTGVKLICDKRLEHLLSRAGYIEGVRLAVDHFRNATPSFLSRWQATSGARRSGRAPLTRPRWR